MARTKKKKSNWQNYLKNNSPLFGEIKYELQYNATEFANWHIAFLERAEVKCSPLSSKPFMI